MKCAEHERNKELLSQQATQISGLENAKSWLERRLNEADVCLHLCYILRYFSLSVCWNTVAISSCKYSYHRHSQSWALGKMTPLDEQKSMFVADVAVRFGQE